MSQQTTDHVDEQNRLEEFVHRVIYEPEIAYKSLFYVVTGFFLLMALFPFYWLVSLALTPNERISGMGLTPNGFHWESFIEIFQLVPFHWYMFNSLLLALMTTALVLVVGSLAGYIFGRLEFPGRNVLLIGILVISYFPPAAFLIPLFRLFNGNIVVFGIRSPELFNTPGAIVFPLSGLVMPLIIFILATFYSQIPDGLEDAARIEGSTRIGALFRIIVPLSAPGVATAGVLSFIIVYNEFFFSFLMTDGAVDHWAPIIHGVFRYQGARAVFYNHMAAAAVVGVIPMAIMVLIAQERIVSGLTAGAIKE